MKLIIAFPIYVTNELHVDFTRQAIESIVTKHDYQIYLVGNYVAPEFRDAVAQLPGTYVENTTGNCVSKAWNMGIEEGLKSGADYILLPNNDILFHPSAIDNLVDFAESHPEFLLWSGAEHADMRTLNRAVPGDSFDEHPHFSCFMIAPRTVRELQKAEDGTGEPVPGFFDPGYKAAYFEDNDMHQRLLHKGFKAGHSASALFYHFGSRTIRTDEELDFKNKHTYEANREYFISKWGFDPHGAAIANESPIRLQFKKPFNK